MLLEHTIRVHRISRRNTVTDKVFLLSITEVNRYFNKSEKAAKCEPTEFAAGHGAAIDVIYGEIGHPSCSWWLRTPGRDTVYAAIVKPSGSIDHSGDMVQKKDVAVRPAIWIQFDD